VDSFRKGVHGYFDVADQLSRYLRHRAADQFSNEREEKRSINSQREFEARRKRVRETFLSSVGELPDNLDDPVETMSILERDGYSIELVTFKSLPNFHVSANCYVPAGNGPHPGILFLCGHVETAKADVLNQKACIELALNGFVVVIIDPIAQGERKQYRDPETGETLVSGGGGVFAHCYSGQKCFYAGANLARYMIHDARCALDYLYGRSDVDDDRIGVTGASGGGVQTAYLSLVDDRIDAAAPCCSVTEREEWLKTGKRIDAEQNIYGAISRGINYDDFVTAMAPQPVCIGAAASDEYFPIEGVHDTFDRAQRIYDLYDADENISLVIADTTHCSVYELGDGVFEWLCDHLSDDEYVSHDELPVVDETELQCTPQGSVRSAYNDERTIDDLICEYIAETYPNVGAAPTIDDRDEYAKRLRRSVIEKFNLYREDCDLHPRYISRSESKGLDIEHVFFKSERDPDIGVTGVLVSDSEATPRSPAVVLYENGTESLPERSADIASLAAECGTVFVFDPRGVGAVRNREIPIPNWIDDYYGIYGTEFKLAYDALMLETSLFGMRVYDVLRAIEFLRSETGEQEITLIGEGIGAYHALYAGAVDENVGTIDLRDLGPSFYEIATGEFLFNPQLTVYDVIGNCDVPHLIAALDDRELHIDRTTD
jgi:cephalosporin-C deacetylase-like acetyl esterase